MYWIQSIVCGQMKCQTPNMNNEKIIYFFSFVVPTSIYLLEVGKREASDLNRETEHFF